MLENIAEKKLTLPIDRNILKNLRAGESVLLSGVIYTARDAAHKRILETIAAGIEPPIKIKDAVIYYAGPTPARDGYPIGSVGPTTSYRMDTYTPELLDMGLAAMIGKGDRNSDVVDAIIRNGAVYFAAIGGTGALIAKSVKSSELIAYPELGAEAIRKLVVEDFPVTVAIDALGNNLYTK